MTRRAIPAFLLLSLACADRAPAPGASEEVVDVDSVENAVEAAPELPAMPPYPTARPGQLAIRAAGALEADRGWPARGGRCARPAMVVLMAEQPGSGGSILLQLPPTTDLTGTYPIKIADSTGVPAPPAAQVGLQFFSAGGADAYQASEGEVEVRELSDRLTSGRFAITVRHLTHGRLAVVAGAFRDVEVEALPPDWCARAAAAQDSLAAAADTLAGDP